MAVLVGGLRVLQGELTVGTLLVALAYLGFVYGPLAGIANTTGSIHQALASARRVRETLALTPESENPGGLQPSRVEGAIEFVDVSFAYRERMVLRNVSFTARPGETIALVGPSGSGKTTLVSLIARFYEPTSGSILLDGIELSKFRLSSLRQQVAIVHQEAVMLSGTIADNVRYGLLDASHEQIEAAARSANADEFIDHLPDRYETVLGEGGAGLSGGQKQRLSMARAFLKDAPILILDEPTAALDTISERLVFSGIRRLRSGRTTIVIAHRLSTVREADRILVLEGGRLVDEGTHDSLMRTSELYRRLAAQLTEDLPDGI
jgi:ABC-type multidrug transport system fused ATPase/permease subunit